MSVLDDLLASPPSSPDLSEDEIRWLRAGLAPHGPLYKIVKSAFDHANVLRDNIAAVPLIDAEAVARARDLQMQRDAATRFLMWFVQACEGKAPVTTPSHVIMTQPQRTR